MNIEKLRTMVRKATASRRPRKTDFGDLNWKYQRELFLRAFWVIAVIFEVSEKLPAVVSSIMAGTEVGLQKNPTKNETSCFLVL